MRIAYGLAMILLLASFASPATAQETASRTLPVSNAATLLDTRYPSHWYRTTALPELGAPDDTLQYPIDDFDFLDNSAMGRMSRLRSLSLLTLGRFGGKRLFVGVNSDGLFGVHYNTFPDNDSDNYVEIARMPYLRVEESAEGD